MTERDKITIFDAIIKLFQHPEANSSDRGTGNLFAEAIRSIINIALLAQRDAIWAVCVMSADSEKVSSTSRWIGSQKNSTLPDKSNSEQILLISTPPKFLCSE